MNEEKQVERQWWKYEHNFRCDRLLMKEEKLVERQLDIRDT